MCGCACRPGELRVWTQKGPRRELNAFPFGGGVTDSWKCPLLLWKKRAGVHPSSRLLSMSPTVVSGTSTVRNNFILVVDTEQGSLSLIYARYFTNLFTEYIKGLTCFSCSLWDTVNLVMFPIFSLDKYLQDGIHEWTKDCWMSLL